MLVKSLLRHKVYLYILIATVLVRILWAVAVPVDPVSDSYAYDTFAKNLAIGQGYGWNSKDLTAFWPPGTSFIYALLYLIFGHTYIPIIILNLFVSLVIVAVTMRLAEVWFNPTVATSAGWLLALWPSQIQFTTVLASELLFNAFVLIALLLWLNEQMTLRFRAIWVGVTLAAASYVRPTALLIPILLLFFRWIYSKELFKTVTATLIMVIVMALLIAPWSYRNTQLFGQFVTISTNSGSNLWMGNNPKSTGGYMNLPPEVKGMNEAQRDDYLESIAKNHIKEEPLLFLKRCVTRIFDTHSRESIGIAWNQKGLTKRYGEQILRPLKILNQVYWMSMLGLSLIGIILLVKQKGLINTLIHPTILIWGYYAAVHAIIVSQDRYHFPSIPMISILAAIPIAYYLKIKHKSLPIANKTSNSSM